MRRGDMRLADVWPAIRRWIQAGGGTIHSIRDGMAELRPGSWSMCHGARGMSEANSPNLVGQDSGAIYKQLRDYRTGHRASVVMAPRVQDLSDRDMRDLAGYYR